MTTYNPLNHYWLATDGRMFSSAAQALVPADPVLSAQASVWPRDDAGAQTDAALQDVLRPFGVSVNLSYYAAYARWLKIEGGITVNGIPFPCDQGTLSALNSATIYVESVAGAGATINWKLPDGTFTQLNKDEIKQLQLASQGFCQACYNCESSMLTGIAGGTVTTRLQVDDAFAAINTAYTKTASAEGMSISETLLRRRSR